MSNILQKYKSVGWNKGKIFPIFWIWADPRSGWVKSGFAFNSRLWWLVVNLIDAYISTEQTRMTTFCCSKKLCTSEHDCRFDQFFLGFLWLEKFRLVLADFFWCMNFKGNVMRNLAFVRISCCEFEVPNSVPNSKLHVSVVEGQTSNSHRVMVHALQHCLVFTLTWGSKLAVPVQKPFFSIFCTSVTFPSKNSNLNNQWKETFFMLNVFFTRFQGSVIQNCGLQHVSSSKITKSTRLFILSISVINQSFWSSNSHLRFLKKWEHFL